MNDDSTQVIIHKTVDISKSKEKKKTRNKLLVFQISLMGKLSCG